jgi:cytochrome b561
MSESIVAQPAQTRGVRYDPTTIALHWTAAVLVVILWTIGQTIDFPPTAALRNDYRSVHIVLGVTLGAVLLVRLVWRLTRYRTLPPTDQGVLLLLARFTHFALYVLLFLTVALGIGTAWTQGDALFNLVAIPAYDPGNRALMRLVHGWHALAANTVLIVAGVHAAAALFHHFIMRDVTLRRMLPWELR